VKRSILASLTVYFVFSATSLAGSASYPNCIFNGIVGDASTGNGNATEMDAFFRGHGFLSLAVKAEGAFSGNLRLEGASLPFKGSFSQSGNATVTVKRPNKYFLDTRIQIDFVAAADRSKITCTMVFDGKTLQTEILPSAFTGAKGNTHPLTRNRYTVILPIPDGANEAEGYGYATILVDPNGTAKIAGILFDGASFTTASGVIDDGNGDWIVPVHVPLYKSSGGILWGELVLPKVEQSDAPDVSGSLDWLRPANINPPAFPKGFLDIITPVGTRYSLSKEISFLSRESRPGNFNLHFYSTVQSGTWPASNKPLLDKPTPGGMSMTFNPATGIFQGVFNSALKGNPVPVPYKGVVFSKSITVGAEPIRGGGFYPVGTSSAPLLLTLGSNSQPTMDSTFSIPVLGGGNATVQRWGTGDRGIVFFNNSNAMDTQIIAAIAEYSAVLGNNCSIFVWSYPENVSPFDYVQTDIDAWLNYGQPYRLDFTDVATNVVNGIRQSTGLKKLLLVGNSLGGGVLLWDYPALSADPDLRFLLVSPTEMFSPNPSNLTPLSKGILLANKAGDPFVSNPLLKKWIAENMSKYSGGKGHLILEDNISHQELAAWINFSLMGF